MGYTRSVEGPPARKGCGVKTIVVTGSTRGIGFGLANAFLDLSCNVVVSGRMQEAVDKAMESLAAQHERERILGQTCDVTDYAQVEALWDAAKTRFGAVDIWINNAGISHPTADFWTHPPQRIRAVVETNVVGAMYGASVALSGMHEQGHGALYNMEGLGSGGPMVPGTTLYATTKSALHYLTEALAKEVEGSGLVVGALQPGMVVTDLLMGREGERGPPDARSRRVMNILADRVETVTPWLARKALANERNGARIRWLTQWKVLGRFARAPFHERHVLPEA
jgi:NAD(P)-dependent dehydrogenase (short-subunit alcohol dehydrogenase family)